MERVSWKTVFILGLISMSSGRFVGPFYQRINSQDLWKNKDSMHRLTGSDVLHNLRPNIARERQNEERLSEAEFSTYSLQEPNGPGTYAFGYDNVADPTGNEHFRSEERLQNGTIMGEYGYTDYKNKKLVRVSYIADLRGYRAKTEVLPLDDIYQ